jgi:hypothetical protein
MYGNIWQRAEGVFLASVHQDGVEGSAHDAFATLDEAVAWCRMHFDRQDVPFPDLVEVEPGRWKLWA